ncbi:DDE-type integrase/transposase/recombinase [Herbaspirillum chlorophenolicum]|uniref:DDE-type integrase/transposase/recombinase n=1 Tax=Herbaspirillum chlorophenolicum TaxID=211589 RepID=UPI00067C8F75|nr:DDE-type integrase/transposase/recombinase [Herbaspirillum chlorophenolicum]
MPDFRPNDLGFARWQVLEFSTPIGIEYLRVTHIFDRDVYVMKVKEALDVRHARRPIRYSLTDFKAMSERAGARWGRISMPAEFISPPPSDSRRAQQMEICWQLIEPLIDLFESSMNLSMAHFTSLIRARAEAKSFSFDSARRLLLRYYYFGGTKNALLPFHPGTKPTKGRYKSESESATSGLSAPKRRGRKSIKTQILGENEFVVSELDIADMVSSLRRQLRRARTGYLVAWRGYLATEFARRHKKLYEKYQRGEIEEPVTKRQYQYYLDQYAQLDASLAENLVTRTAESGHSGVLMASAPGDIYEIDGTGGRLHLVTKGNPPIVVDRPNIYLLIDRWSRFVVSAYISLKPPSYEELRYALLIGFTSRTRRFKAMGCNVDDDKWPVGRIPHRIVADRGSEFLSEAIEQSLTTDLRIRLTNLPPYCPDGKAIIERFIRTMKSRMVEKGMSGVYAERPMNPVAARAKKRAASAATTSLQEAYRELLAIVVEYNNRPHSTLKKYRELTQAAVEPTPQQAYLWGIKHKASKGAFPYSEDELSQIFLSADTATIAHGKVTYRDKTYFPKNNYAEVLAKESGARAKKVSIRVDKTYPHAVYVSSNRGERAEFEISASGADTLGVMTLDEEEAFEHEGKLLWAMSNHRSNLEQVGDLNGRGKVKRHRPEAINTQPNRAEIQAAREQDTEQQKMILAGRGEVDFPASKAGKEIPEWQTRKNDAEAAHVALIAKMRAKK